MNKATFIQHLVIRFGHEPAKVLEIIERGEAIADVRTAKGYGFDSPHPDGSHAPALEPKPANPVPTPDRGNDQNKIGWDGLAPPKKLIKSDHQAYQEFSKTVPAPTLQELQHDLAHWVWFHQENPNDAITLFNLQTAQRKLGIPVENPVDLDTLNLRVKGSPSVFLDDAPPLTDESPSPDLANGN